MIMTSALIPRRLLFQNPSCASYKTDPHGQYLTYLAPFEGVMNLWLQAIDRKSPPRPLTKCNGRGVRSYGWTYRKDCLVYIQDKDGDENWRIYALDVGTGKTQCLTPESGVHATIEGISHLHPDHIIIGLNDRNPELHDFYRASLETGEKTLVLENPGFAGVLFDHHFALRLSMKLLSHGGAVYYLGSDMAAPFMEVDAENAATTHPMGFSLDGQRLYLLDSREKDTSVFVSLDMTTKETTVLCHDPKADASGVLFHPETKEPQAYSSTYFKTTWIFLDPAFEKDWAAACTQITKLSKGDHTIDITSRTLDDEKWIMVAHGDTAPAAYYLFDRKTQSIAFLAHNRPDLASQPLRPMEPLEIPARDGLALVCYMTLPEAVTGPCPFVLLIHGGPRARDDWGYDALHQWLANRGYGVISVNYRGSTGFGKSFMNKGNGAWAREMHEDLLDVVAWCVDQGYADPTKVAIMGGSYGGYATLVGMTQTPDVFCCGVDIVGPSNLQTLVASLPPYWKPARDMMKVMLGTDFDTPEGQDFLRDRSPLTHCDALKKPLLIVQGANDPRVKQAESDQIANALKERGVPFIYLLYPDEGHGLVRPENRMSLYAVTEAFFAKTLGGQCEPLGDDFKGASMEIKEGSELIDALFSTNKGIHS